MYNLRMDANLQATLTRYRAELADWFGAWLDAELATAPNSAWRCAYDAYTALNGGTA